MSDLNVRSCIDLLLAAAPPLNDTSYKGQAGKIAVIGGSAEYTGAPYFAGISAMRAGAELSFVYCAEGAAQAIKSYSPDLIVYPGFHHLGEDCKALSRMHAIVVGPGLGREEEAATVVQRVVGYACENNIPLVMDADALFFLAGNKALREYIRDASPSFVAYMTPNKVELERIMGALDVSSAEGVVNWFKGRIVLVEKGRVDRIITDTCTVNVDTVGSLKRVGGQGDFLAGVMALFCAWLTRSATSDEAVAKRSRLVAAAVCACVVTKVAARLAFAYYGRSLLASDIVAFLGKAIDEMVENKGLDDKTR